MKTIIRILLVVIAFFSVNASIAQLKNPKKIPFKWKTDTLNKTVDLSEISVVLPRKSFPAIDYPDFVNKDVGLMQFFNQEPVIAVAINGAAKAYPLNMLTMHEISNDSLGGVPILPTYCPLCNSSMVYDRRLKHNGKEYLLDFEVSGMLRNSDMVMADKQTETWWQQLMGEGIVGELAGAELTIIPSMVISVEDFFNNYPNGLILSKKTNTPSEARYGFNPYKKYDDKKGKPYERFFNHESIDARLEPMERLIDIRGKDGYKVYPFSTIAKKQVINDTYDGKDIVIFFKKGTISVLDENEINKSKDIGAATVFSSIINGKKHHFKKSENVFVDIETTSKWDITGTCFEGELKGIRLTPVIHSNHFAFAFFSFHSNVTIYTE